MLITDENKTHKIELVAHRGASSIAPENTLTSIELGWELNSDAVEIDVHLSKDNRIMLIHDETTLRTTGQNLVVSESTSEELRKLDAGIFKSPEYAGQTIPFLEEILPGIPAGRKLYIEIKCDSKIFPVLTEIIQRSGKISQVSIIGFDLNTITLSKKYLPEIPVYWLCDTIQNKQTSEIIPHSAQLIDLAHEQSLDGLSVRYDGITKEFTEQTLSSGLRLFAWTVNDPDAATRLVRFGVHGIVTDCPDTIRRNLKHTV